MKTLTTALFVVTLIASARSLAAADRPAAVPAGLRFIPIAPCRLLDTAVTKAANKIEESLRHVDLDGSRCGSLMPRYAIHYSLQLTTYSTQAPETLPAGTVPVRQAIALAANANRKLDFDVPAGSHIAVDVDGYYVAPGTPIFPFDTPGNGAGATSTASGTRSASTLQPRTQTIHDGTPSNGDIYLVAAAPYPASGIRLDVTQSPGGWQHIINRLGDPATASGFWIYDSTTAPSQTNAIMNVMANGHVTVMRNGYLDGRTSYMQGPSVPGNVIHDVTITNPLDSAGSSNTRVVFFNGNSTDEAGSPATTKFQAFTKGQFSQNNINFDSQLLFHIPGAPFYHFRAFSTQESKDTFWVKAATNGTSTTNTRADMYISGHVGIGSPNIAPWGPGPAIEGPTSAIEFGYVGDFHLASNAYQDTGGWRYKAAGPAANYYLFNGGHAWRVAGSGTANNNITWTTPMTLDSSGLSVTGTIHATALQFPDTTIQTTAYPFSNTNNTYDLSRAIAGALASSVTNTSSSPSASASLAAVAANGVAYVRLGSTATPAKDWRIGLVDNSGVFKIRDNTGTGTDVMSISGPSATPSIAFTGNVTATTIQATYQDVAEWVPSDGEMSAGTVVTLNPLKANAVTASSKAYDTAVAGVVSDQPGLLLGMAGMNKSKIATTGRVKVRVDARTHPVKIGDLLVTSDIPGTAMLSEPLDINGRKFHQPGTLIGKALEPLASGEGKILVLLSLQ